MSFDWYARELLFFLDFTINLVYRLPFWSKFGNPTTRFSQAIPAVVMKPSIIHATKSSYRTQAGECPLRRFPLLGTATPKEAKCANAIVICPESKSMVLLPPPLFLAKRSALIFTWEHSFGDHWVTVWKRFPVWVSNILALRYPKTTQLRLCRAKERQSLT